MGDVGKKVGDGVSERVPRVEVVLGKMLECLLVEKKRVVWPASRGGVSPFSAVRFQKRAGLWVVLVEGVGPDVEEGEAAREFGEEFSPSKPEVGVVASDGFGKPKGACGIEVEGFGISDDEQEAGVEELGKSGDGSMKLGPRDRLVFWA